MKSVTLLGTVLATAVSISPARAQCIGSTTARSACRPLTELFPVGERAVYEAKWGIIKVGTARMEVMGIDTLRGEETLHLTFHMQGGTFLYRLDNVMESWVGLRDFMSRRFVQDNQEGNWERHRDYAIFPDSGFYRRAALDTTFESVPEPLDDASFFYFLRTVDLEPGHRYEYHRYFRPDRNPVVLEIVGRDTIDVPAGRFATVVARPIIKGGGIFAEKAEGHVWIADDETRMVVQIKSKFAFGSVTLRLAEVVRPDAP